MKPPFEKSGKEIIAGNRSRTELKDHKSSSEFTFFSPFSIFKLGLKAVRAQKYTLEQTEY